MPERALVVHIVGDTRSLDRAFAKATKDTKSFGSRMGGILKGAAIGGAFAAAGTAVYGFTKALQTGYDEMVETQKVTAQTNAVLRSTGRVAGVSRRQVEKLADQLSQMSGVDDELIQSAENVMLTFTKIGGKGGIFEDATRAALDLSERFGTDLQTAALQVGKALNDPIRGVGALRRAGVQLTDQQQDQIKAFVKAGDTMKAQRIILKELQTEVGGAAKAAGGTLPRALDKLRNTIANTLGRVMERLAPKLEELFTRWAKIVDRWASDPKNIEKVADAIESIVDAIVKVISWIPKLVHAWQEMQEFFRRSQIIIQRTALQIALGFLRAIQVMLDALPDWIANKLGENQLDKAVSWLQGRIGRYNTELANLGGGGQVAVYTGTINVHGVQNLKQFEDEMARRHQSSSKRRRGAR